MVIKVTKMNTKQARRTTRTISKLLTYSFLAHFPFVGWICPRYTTAPEDFKCEGEAHATSDREIAIVALRCGYPSTKGTAELPDHGLNDNSLVEIEVDNADFVAPVARSQIRNLTDEIWRLPAGRASRFRNKQFSMNGSTDERDRLFFFVVKNLPPAGRQLGGTIYWTKDNEDNGTSGCFVNCSTFSWRVVVRAAGEDDPNDSDDPAVWHETLSAQLLATPSVDSRLGNTEDLATALITLEIPSPGFNPVANAVVPVLPYDKAYGAFSVWENYETELIRTTDIVRFRPVAQISDYLVLTRYENTVYSHETTPWGDLSLDTEDTSITLSMPNDEVVASVAVRNGIFVVSQPVMNIRRPSGETTDVLVDSGDEYTAVSLGRGRNIISVTDDAGRTATVDVSVGFEGEDGTSANITVILDGAGKVEVETGDGKVECEGADTRCRPFEVSRGANLSFRALPSENGESQFLGWDGDCSPDGNNVNIANGVANEDLECTASFGVSCVTPMINVNAYFGSNLVEYEPETPPRFSIADDETLRFDASSSTLVSDSALAGWKIKNKEEEVVRESRVDNWTVDNPSQLELGEYTAQYEVDCGQNKYKKSMKFYVDR